MALAALISVSAVVAAVGGTPAAAGSRLAASPANTLVAAMFFDGKTLDPGREFENMGNAADHAMYDTLVTFTNGNLAKVRPDAATTWSASKGGAVYTFTLRQGVHFASGNPMTAADVAWSLTRQINLKGTPSFLLANVVSVTAPSPSTVRITLKHPDPALLFILANPSLSILDSKTVMAHGGTDAANATKADKAESYLNAHSAGSGPYMLTSYSPGNSIAMTANPTYWSAAPKVKNVLILNQQAPTEKLTLQKGDTDIGVNLSANQVPGLKKISTLTTYSLSSPNTFFLILNMDPAFFKPTANSDVRQAIRYALDYKGLVSLAGPGAVQSPGIVPVQFPGALSPSGAVQQNVTKAKALLAKAGYPHGFSVSMEYPSDITIVGVDFNLFAQKLQSDLGAVGITVKLLPKPIAVSLPDYRSGKEQIGFWEWGPDYPDSEDYLAFLPGQTVGLRANWKTGADATLATWMTKASTTANNTERAGIYRQIQQRMNQVGPFVMMFQPAQIVATQRTVTGFHYNYLWQTDFNVVGK